ncbi:hypothetical protein ACP3WT_27725, partial [Salmonella enterica]|uniref:hypothetical protein n=1 Tax=Salmonella enterica TaxID=28901 RepID=UPI003CF126EA
VIGNTLAQESFVLEELIEEKGADCTIIPAPNEITSHELPTANIQLRLQSPAIQKEGAIRWEFERPASIVLPIGC